MKANVKREFVHSETQKTYKLNQTFSGSKEEIDRINSVLDGALEAIEDVKPKK